MSYHGLNPRTATNDELNAAADDIAYNDLCVPIQGLPGDNTISEDLQAWSRN